MAIQETDSKKNAIIIGNGPSLNETVKEKLQVLQEKAAGNLQNGGRGIGNMTESLLITPLARYLFDENISEGTSLLIEAVDVDTMPASIRCRVVR